MREILFRGKRVDNGEWVEGFYGQFHNRPTVDKPNSHQIFELIDEGVKLFGSSIGGYWHIVDPETVGQFTGLTDKNGKKIFEGDILKNDYEDIEVVEFYEGRFLPFNPPFAFNCWCEDEIEVIGNTMDNPELLKGGDDNA